MQDLVADRLEKRLQELTWYDRVETSTRPGYAYMTLTLKDSTPPAVVQEEFYQARKKLGDEGNLPPGVLGPFVNDEYSDVSFALYALKARGMPMRELARQAEVIRQDLLHVPGVKKINILGERPEQIFVEFSYAKLATLGVPAQEIVAALQRQNSVTPTGSIDTRGPQVFIRSRWRLRQRPSDRRHADRRCGANAEALRRRRGSPRLRGSSPPFSSEIRVSPPSCSRRLCRKDGTASRSARH